MVQSQLVQQGGVQVCDVVPILHGVEADLVGRSVHCAPANAAAGHPDREAVGVMIATI